MINERAHVLNSNKIYLLPANQSFSATYIPGSEFFYFHLHFQDCFGHDIFQSCKNIASIEEKPFLFQEITNGYLQENTITWQTALFHAVVLFCAPLLKHIALQSHNSVKYHDLLIFLRDNINPSLRIEELAERFGFSYAALSKGFKRDLGISLKEYIIDLLLKKARELLVSSDMNVSEIADALGYEDSYYFQHIFKEKMGETPLQYRRQTRAAICRDH